MNTPDPAPMLDKPVEAAAPQSLRALVGSRIDFLTKHFAVISATITLAAAAGTTLCLAGYLSAFDSSLIWLVQYTDLIQFVLIAVPTLAASAYLVELIFNFAMEIADEKKPTTTYTKIVAACVIVIFAMYLIADETSETPQYLYHFLLFGCVMWLIMWLRQFLLWRRNPETLTLAAIGQNMAAFVVALGLFGGTFGHYVRDVRDKRYDVSTKSGEIKSVNLVMSLSRATILYDRKRVLVIPEAEIQRITEIKPEDEKRDKR